MTAVHDKDGWLGALRFWQRLEAEGALRCASGSRCRTTSSASSRARRAQPASATTLLRVGYLKAFMDGTLGSQTARMLDGSGVEITSREELEEIIRARRAAGFPVAVHAIGDLANREALDAFEATREVWQPRGLRQRIEHAQLLAPEDVPRFAELGVAASVQFTTRPPTATSPTASGPADRRRLRLPLAARLGRGARERLGRADRGARPAAGIRAGVRARSTSARRGTPSRR